MLDRTVKVIAFLFKKGEREQKLDEIHSHNLSEHQSVSSVGVRTSI